MRLGGKEGKGGGRKEYTVLSLPTLLPTWQGKARAVGGGRREGGEGLKLPTSRVLSLPTPLQGAVIKNRIERE